MSDVGPTGHAHDELAVAWPARLPVLPLRDSVLFPQLMMPLVIHRPAAIAAVLAALGGEEKTVAVAAQIDDVENPRLDQLYPVGVVAIIKKMSRVEQTLQIVLQGTTRIRLRPAEPSVTPSNATDALSDSAAGADRGNELPPLSFPWPAIHSLYCSAEPIPLPVDWTPDLEAMHREVLQLAQQLIQMVNPPSEPAFRQMLSQMRQPLPQVYLLSTLLSLSTVQEQELLAAESMAQALQRIHDHLTREMQVLKIRQQITSQVQTELSTEQRHYFLRKQLEAIQEELGEQNREKVEIDELKSRLEGAGIPAASWPNISRELTRLERLPNTSPDYQITRNYLELVAELPWQPTSATHIDLREAQRILDEDHYDLEKIKERILEHLAVQKLNPQAKSPILCFVGPPGVGKTSLGKSIARSVGREFVRISLGGLHDEAELRGHRRTYLGSLPGRLIQAVRQAKVRNPLLMLDEIDKLGRDFRGDPSAALLEILDPAQNHEFRDNYLDVPFDLSQVFFIATANQLDPIPAPLLDRLEVVRLAGYSDEDKLHISRTYLLPRQRQEAGLQQDQLLVTDGAIQEIIQHYTREAGVRQLERVLGRLGRKVATRIASGDMRAVQVDREDLREWLGGTAFPRAVARQQLPAGVAAGLAWTAAGGELLYVESVILPDPGELRITGQLGEIMKESARAAQSYIGSRWAELDLDKRALRSSVHLHVPAGATPKDGPSAGVTMATALASLYTAIPVRDDVAMTGEITLSGLVLPVGGVREKVLAAYRAGIRTVIIPDQNESDQDELSPHVRQAMQFILARTVDDVLIAAIPPLEPRIRAHS